MQTHEVTVRELRVLRGPNIWAYMPALQIIMDIGPYEEQPSSEFPGMVGMTCTDGTYINKKLVIKGDCSGPRSAQVVLLHPHMQVAVRLPATASCERGRPLTGAGSAASPRILSPVPRPLSLMSILMWSTMYSLSACAKMLTKRTM